MELELKDYVRIIMKRLWLIVSLVIVIAAATAAVSFWILQPVYQSSTQLIVNNSQDMSKSMDLNSVNLDLRLVETYKQIVKTNVIIDKVVERNPELGLTSGQIKNMISVSSVNNTQMITIAAKHNDYATTVLVTNEVAKVFVEEIPKIMTVNNVSILNEAQSVKNPSPIAPNPVMNVMLSIIVALLLGVGLALLLEYLDDSIKDEHDVLKYIDLPVLMTIPRVNDEDFSIGKSSKKVKTEVGSNVTVSK